ncbi:hypothetical protein NMG60_11030103 [Bertholletia excelsa]
MSTNKSSHIESYAFPPVTIILTLILLAFFFVGFFSLYFCRCVMQNLNFTWYLRRSPGTPVGPACPFGCNGLHPSIIQSFPKFTYSDVKDLRREKGDLECAICLSEFIDDDALRLLPTCHHVFHQECIDLWLGSQNTCPVCRRSLEDSPEKSPVPTPIAGNDEDNPLVDSFVINITDNNERERGGAVEAMAMAMPPDTADSVERTQVESKGGRMSRSHSTGHSIGRNRFEEEDRYTLRIPPENLHTMHVRLKTRHLSWIMFGELRSAGDGSSRSVPENCPRNLKHE